MRTNPSSLFRSSLISLVFVLLLLMCSPALATDISIYIDGTKLQTDVAPIMENNRTLVPFRACSEALNAQVNYDNPTITMTKNGKTVTLTIGSKTAYINGEPQTMEVAAKIKDGRTLVPLRFVGEALSADVEWQNNTNTIYISTTGEAVPPITDPNPPSSGGTTTVPSDQELTQTLLKACNDVRSQKGLSSLVISTEYSSMALGHSSDMAANGFLSNTSPSKGNAAKRARNYSLTAPAENVCRLNLANDGSIAACVDTWLRSDTTRANLLHPSARYVGIGISADKQNPSLIYVAVEFLESDAYFTMPLTYPVYSNKVTLEGYTLNSTDQIEVYRLSTTNENIYVDKQAFTVTPTNGKFNHDLTLWSQGNYLVKIGNSTVKIQYK